MVTIRNDIEANGNANRQDSSASSVVDGSKNVNHLANGSRRSTMGDIKPKAFNRKCVGLLALIVCVGVCFGVGMLFLYGHLVDRLNESANHGSMLHDKNGNPVKPFTTTTTTTTSGTTSTTTITTEPTPTSSPSSAVVDFPTMASIPLTSTTEMAIGLSTTAKREDGAILLDSGAEDNDKSAETSTRSWVKITTEERSDDTKESASKPSTNRPKGKDSGSGDYSGDDSDDDDYWNDEGSGNRKN